MLKYATFAPPIVRSPYDGLRFLFAVYATFVPIVWVLLPPPSYEVRTTDSDIYLLWLFNISLLHFFQFLSCHLSVFRNAVVFC